MGRPLNPKTPRKLCQCGRTVSVDHIARHRNTKVHLLLLLTAPAPEAAEAAEAAPEAEPDDLCEFFIGDFGDFDDVNPLR